MSSKLYGFGNKKSYTIYLDENSINKMYVFYEIPYKYKDEAKTKGLKWNPTKKLWYSQHSISTDDKVELRGLNKTFDIVDYTFDFECSKNDYYIEQVQSFINTK